MRRKRDVSGLGVFSPGASLTLSLHLFPCTQMIIRITSESKFVHGFGAAYLFHLRVKHTELGDIP
jgi:hypothetical protein